MTKNAKECTDRRDYESELAEARRALREAESELESMRKEMDSFFYHISHDLQAPLRSVIGFSEAVREDYEAALDEKGLDYLGRVISQARRLNTMIEGLLMLSRAASRKMVLQNVDLSKMARAALMDARRKEPDREIEAEIEDGVHVNGDQELLEKAMGCLIDNACKFSSKSPSPRIEFGTARSNGATYYFVRDNGVGFDPSHADKLFNPFQRLHSRDEFPGEGIGLALVSKVVQRHNGRVWAESREGEGATFCFTLDAKPSP